MPQQVTVDIKYTRPGCRPLPEGWVEPGSRIAVDRLPGLPSLPPDAAKNPFLHKSFLAENRPGHAGNEQDCHKRAEFLGDAILHARAALYLHSAQCRPESGVMTLLNHRITTNVAWSIIALAYNLDEGLLLGTIAERDGWRINQGILADTFESYVGELQLAALDPKHRQQYAPVVDTFLSRLFSDDVFPDAQSELAEIQANKIAYRGARPGLKERMGRGIHKLHQHQKHEREDGTVTETAKRVKQDAQDEERTTKGKERERAPESRRDYRERGYCCSCCTCRHCVAIQRRAGKAECR